MLEIIRSCSNAQSHDRCLLVDPGFRVTCGLRERVVTGRGCFPCELSGRTGATRAGPRSAASEHQLVGFCAAVTHHPAYPGRVSLN